MKRIFIFILSAFLIASCLPQNVQVPQSPLLPLLERKSGLIGYVGTDGNIYVVDQRGRNPIKLTNDAIVPKNQGDPLLLYEYPTWSRDGNQLAFIGVNSDGKQEKSNVVVANIDKKSVKEIYASDSERPVYLNWSPDNANLSFLSTDVSGQNLILKSVSAQGGDPAIFDTGAPYYWSWAPDGHVMIVHAGGAAASSPERTAFLSIGSSNITEQVLDATSTSSGSTQVFQAPAWSPDGSHIALARVTDKENQIVVTDVAGKNPKKVGAFTSKTAFAWSSDGKRIAYLDGQQPLAAGTLGSLHVVDLGTSREIVEDGDIIAFFWSPGGKEIAYFILAQVQDNSSSSGNSGDSTQTPPQYALDLRVLDVTSGESHKVFTYVPTQQFLSILPYFDQYDQSVTIWSPDNNNLVLSLIDTSSGNPSIAIVAASGHLEPRLLAEGYLAFWSWK
jgi:Tol biopolymer transport system component